MNSHDLFLKNSWSEWVKQSFGITEIVGNLEKEIERLREKKLPESLIDQKDETIDKLINFYNTTDQLINGYRIALANKEAELLIMRDLLEHAIRTDWRERILARLTDDLNELKERRQLKNELRNKING